MIILTSPAKTQDFITPYKAFIKSPILFPEAVGQIIKTLDQLSETELKKLYGISDELIKLNFNRIRDWQKNKKIEKPAIFAYHGDIFKGMHPHEYTDKQAKYLQDSLRIISGMYGLVRPYDLIRPYRLEMIVPIHVGKYKNLYDFWKEKTTNYLNEELEKSKNKIVINLASDEYGNIIDFSKLKGQVIKIGFRQKKGNKIANIGFLSKKARGFMIDFMTKNMITDREKLKGFNTQEYKFLEEKEDSMIFIKSI